MTSAMKHFILLALLCGAAYAQAPMPPDALHPVQKTERPLICPVCYNFPRDDKYYFEDIFVIETVSRRQLTVNEVMELLDRQPNVKSVSIRAPKRPTFSLDTLAYPQYEKDYQLTQDEWKALQLFCKKRLEDNAVAADSVIAHWKSIASGVPPFGLKVQAP